TPWHDSLLQLNERSGADHVEDFAQLPTKFHRVRVSWQTKAGHLQFPSVRRSAGCLDGEGLIRSQVRTESAPALRANQRARSRYASERRCVVNFVGALDISRPSRHARFAGGFGNYRCAIRNREL